MKKNEAKNKLKEKQRMNKWIKEVKNKRKK